MTEALKKLKYFIFVSGVHTTHKQLTNNSQTTHKQLTKLSKLSQLSIRIHSYI